MKKNFEVHTKEELDALQRAFFALITDKMLPGDHLKSHPHIERLIKPNELLTAKERLELYARQYWWRTLQSLEDDFKGVQALLGAETFRELITDYIHSYGSGSFTLRHLGRKFPEFIKDHGNKLQDLQILSYDSARYELYQIESFFAETLPKVEENKLNSIVAEGKTIHFIKQPHVYMLDAAYPIHEILSTIKKDQLKDNETNSTAQKTEADTASINLQNKKETFLALHRFNNSVFAKEISFEEFTFLSLLARPITIEVLLTEAQKKITTISEEEIFGIFQKFSHLQWITVQLEGHDTNN
jgi:hypothetical protein